MSISVLSRYAQRTFKDAHYKARPVAFVIVITRCYEVTFTSECLVYLIQSDISRLLTNCNVTTVEL